MDMHMDMHMDTHTDGHGHAVDRKGEASDDATLVHARGPVPCTLHPTGADAATGADDEGGAGSRAQGPGSRAPQGEEGAGAAAGGRVQGAGAADHLAAAATVTARAALVG